MSYTKRYFEDHIDEYSDEEILEWGWADNIEQVKELRWLITGSEESKKS